MLALSQLDLGQFFWLALSEIYRLRIRGIATSIGTIANWGANLIVAVSFPTLTIILGLPATLWLYGIITIGAWTFANFCVPETKGKTLEQIEDHWQGGKGARDFEGWRKIKPNITLYVSGPANFLDGPKTIRPARRD